MKTRIISGVAMLPLLAVVYFGGWFIWAAALAVALIGVKEFYKGFEACGAKPNYKLAYLSAVLLYGANAAVSMEIRPEDIYAADIDAMGIYAFDSHITFIWVVLVVVGSMIYGFKVNERKLEDMTSTLLGIMYVVFFSYHIVLIDQSPYRNLIWLVFLTAFGTDIMAYFTGMAIGKHKLCPNLSPKKSVEGAVGGVVGSTVLCGLFGYFVEPEALIMCIVIGILGSVFAQMGDLSASAFKRQMGIKDYGNLIPGHGGILDRFDSVLFTAPLVYYCILFIDIIGL